MGFFKKIGRFVSKAARSAGKQIGKIPVVGSPLSTVYSLTTGPLTLAGDIASGANISKAALRNVKQVAKDAKNIAPYVQAVLSTTGVGSVVSGGIAVGLALADGKPLSKAFVEAAAAAVPGGPVASSLVRASAAVARGEKIDDIALSSLPVSDNERSVIKASLEMSRRVASGQRVDKAAMAQIEKQAKTLPTHIAKALGVGTALGVAQKVQNAAAHGTLTNLDTLAQVGAQAVGKSAILREVQKGLPSIPFQTAVGLMQHTDVSESVIITARNSFSGNDRKAFDIALATVIGGVESKGKALAPKQAAGYYVMKGIAEAPKAQRTAMAKQIAKAPVLRAGALVAVRDMKVEQSLWNRFTRWIGVA